VIQVIFNQITLIINYHIDLVFDDNIIIEIKNNFKVGNVGSDDYNTKPNNIQYIITVLKKANYKIKYDDLLEVYVIID